MDILPPIRRSGIFPILLKLILLKSFSDIALILILLVLEEVKKIQRTGYTFNYLTEIAESC